MVVYFHLQKEKEMNTYHENLQQTVINTLTELANQQAKLTSEKNSAEYNLYYAQGAKVTAADKLNDTKKSTKFADAVNQQSRFNDYQAINLYATVNEFNNDITNSRNNMATVAANLQIASNAIALLASDVGAALNIASASLYKTDTYNRIQEANAYVNEVANEAKSLSMNGMKVSAQTSEIVASELLNQTTALKSQLAQVLKITQAQFDQISAQIITESQILGQVSMQDYQAKGVLVDAKEESDLSKKAYQNSNQQLNYGLIIENASTNGFTVRFNTLGDPHPGFYSDEAKAIRVPSKAEFPRYLIALVPEDKKSLFSSDQAQQLFAQYGDATIAGTRFYEVVGQPAGSSVFKTFEYELDVYGDRIIKGKNYVAYLYIELSTEYKRFIGNFSDLLSAPSAKFVPADSLPEPMNVKYSHGKLTFTADFCLPQEQLAKSDDQAQIDGLTNFMLPKNFQFRCILVEVGRPDDDDVARIRKLQVKKAAGENQQYNANETLSEISYVKSSPIDFVDTIALQVAPSNYTVAQRLDTSPVRLDLAGFSCTANGGVNKRSVTCGFEVVFSSSTTDNFGNRLRNSFCYKPYLLALIDGEDSTAYLPTLTAHELITYTEASVSDFTNK